MFAGGDRTIQLPSSPAAAVMVYDCFTVLPLRPLRRLAAQQRGFAFFAQRFDKAQIAAVAGRAALGSRKFLAYPSATMIVSPSAPKIVNRAVNIICVLMMLVILL